MNFSSLKGNGPPNLSNRLSSSFRNQDWEYDVAQPLSNRSMSRGITNGNIDVQKLIEKLHDVLNFLDENNLAIPAIKVEEAITALKLVEEENRETWNQES